jgi:membrane fusion protein (multidrug efflux system)
VRIGAFVALALLATLADCRKRTEEAAEPQAAPAIVTIAPVGKGDVDEMLRVSGETSALKVLRLASPVAGRVTFLAAQAGDRLAAGETAARVLPLENEAAVNGLRLLDRGRALAAGERDSAARLARDLARRQVELSAPFAAVVAERVKNSGEQVVPGDVILELFDPRSLVTIAQVPIDVVPSLRKGMAVTVRTASGSARGEVDLVLTSLTPATLTVPVRVVFTSPLEPPLRGAAVDCEILLSTHRGALLIPHAALVASASRNAATVVVAADGHAHVRQIETGIRSGNLVEVRSGLRAGEEIVVQGQYGLADGARVRVSAPEASRPPPDAE